MTLSEELYAKYPEEFEGLSTAHLAGKQQAIAFRSCESVERDKPNTGAEWLEGWEAGNALWERFKRER